MKIIFTTLLVGFTMMVGFSQTQQHRGCGTMPHHEALKKSQPNYESDFNQYNKMIDDYIANNTNQLSKTGALITIPVVVHIIYNTAAENVPDAVGADQVKVLNDDFAKLNADASKVTQAAFKPLASGANVRFCLAVRDPSGKATTGITRKKTTAVEFVMGDDKMKKTSTGGEDPWDVKKYVNIWICNLDASWLGYAEFPTGSLSNTYGLVIDYTTVPGGSNSTYNLGRTGTHEFGHCFNLLHIWGDEAACSGSDGCADTPNQGPEHYGTYPVGSIQGDACSSSTMWMNYMDYTDDAAMYMFTANQAARINAVVSTAPWNVLATSNGCTPVSNVGVVETLSSNDVSIYPNPSNDFIYVDLKPMSLENTSIEMYDAVGKLVLNYKVSSFSSRLSISELCKGIYTVRIIANGQQLVKRIIKE